MATAYTQIREYRDPIQLSISNTLGKAATYKQNLYDSNTTAIQQLVNQYAGTDLLRDLEQNYLGDRLKTLTNYINQAGAMDWSRRSVYNDVSNYVGQALDSNVMAGIVSTQRYRKHQAEMNDLKKNKPDLYGVQNDWMATRDLQRYLTSNQLGDVYRQGSYVPYTDVKKELLENSKYLKDFGVETYLDSTDDNVYFKTIKTGERLTKEKANQYIDLVLGEKGKTQLMIDGIYDYKGLSDEQLKSEYGKYIDNIADTYSKSAKALRLQAANSPKNLKDQFLNEANYLDKLSNETISSKGLLTDRDSIASNLYLNRFKQQWSNMLSFDRIKDWKIDDSGMQVVKFQQQVRQDNISNQFKVAELEMDKQKMALEQTKIAADLIGKGLKMDANGNIVEDPTSARNPSNRGITVTKEDKNLEEVEMAPVSQIYSDYNVAYNNAIKDGSKDLIETLSDPQNAKLTKELGFQGKDAAYIINSMVTNPNKYNKLLSHLDANTQDLIRTAQGAYKEKESVSKEIEPLYKDIQRISNGIYNSSGFASFKNDVNLFQGGKSIDDNGNLIDRDVRKNNSLNDRKVREIGVINSYRAQEKLDDDQNELLHQKQLEILNSMNLTPSQRKKAEDALIYKYEGFWSGVTSTLALGVATNPYAMKGLKTIDDGLNWLNRDNKAAGEYDTVGRIVKEASNAPLVNSSLTHMNNQSSNKRSTFGYILDQITDTVIPNYDLNDAGDHDLPGLTDASMVLSRMEGSLKSAKNKAINIKGKTNFLNNVNVDLSSKNGKEIISNIKANLPVGTKIQEDGNAQFKIDVTKGTATVIAPVKQGDEIVPVEVQIPFENLPSQILQKIDLNKKQYLYSANNPNSVGYENFVEIPKSRKEWLSQIETMPISQRTEAVNNPPKTQEDIVKEMENTFGKELVNQHKAEIKNIIDRPIDFQMISEGGQWTVVGKQGNETIMRRPTNQEYIDPNLTNKFLDKLATEQIIENIKVLLRTKE